MEFKVGDKVRTKFGTGKVVANKINGYQYLVNHDDWNKGHNGDGFTVTNGLDLRGNHCYWFNEYELTKLSNQKVIITTDGVTVTARLKEGSNELKKVSAVCNPQDTFDFEIGAKLAFERLFNIEKKEVEKKLYNGKVVCVKPSNNIFTKGKIYTVIDGVLTTDFYGIKSRPYKSLDELNSGDVEFIELVE